MTFKTLDIGALEFDKENPRLPTDLRGSSEADILAYLATKTRIENLMSSIGENDFFPGEAIVVTPQGPDKYTVIEGNRRLAALRLLQDPDQVGRSTIKRAAEEAKSKPTQIPAYIVQSRDDTLQYLGFRHISGVQRWDPLAKARYLESLFERAEGEPSRRYAAVAREIGSTGPSVQRNLDALAAYKSIEERNFYDITEIQEDNFQFGTFYTAVGRTEIANFIGTKEDGQSTHPITTSSVLKQNNLKDLVQYMFKKNDRGETVLGESRNIPKLAAVLDNAESLQALRRGETLETALRITPHGLKDFINRMTRANDELRQANANLYDVDQTDEVAMNLVRESKRIISWISDKIGVSS